MAGISRWDAADLAKRLEKSGRGRARPSGGEWKTVCPAHDDRSPSLYLRNNSEGRLLWNCFAGCSSDDVRDAILAVVGESDQPRHTDATKKREVVKNPWTQVIPVPDTAPITIDDFQHGAFGSPTRIWTYRDVDSSILGWVARYDHPDGKEIIPFTWCKHTGNGSEEVRMKAMAEPRPLYNLHKLHQRPGAPVLISEGEKAADAAEKLFPDWICMAAPGGSSSIKMANFSVLAGRKVIVLSDHDSPGYEMVMNLMNLVPNSADLRIAIWPDRWPTDSEGKVKPYVLKKGDDAADHVENGWTTEKLRVAVQEGGNPFVHSLMRPPAPFVPIEYD